MNCQTAHTDGLAVVVEAMLFSNSNHTLHDEQENPLCSNESYPLVDVGF